MPFNGRKGTTVLHKYDAAVALMVTVSAMPASAYGHPFRSVMGWGQTTDINHDGFVKKAYDHDPKFYVTPSSGSNWDPGSWNGSRAVVYCVNDRYQRCSGPCSLPNYSSRPYKFYYNRQSIPVGGQRMNLLLQENAWGTHAYSINGIWMP